MGITKKINGRIEQAILAAILLLIGILLCFNISAVTLSVIIGALLIAYGALTLLFLVIKKRSIATKAGYLACILTAVGIMMIAEKILSVFVYMLPYVLIVVGAVLFADAFLGRYQRHDGNTAVFAVKLSVGAALVAFAVCLLTVKSLADVIPVAFGVSLIVAALALLANLLFIKKTEGEN